MAVISLLAGIVFLLGDGLWLHHVHLDEFVFRRAVTQGQIVENTYERHSNTRNWGPTYGYRAKVRFLAGGERSVTVDDWYASNPPQFILGQSVTVFYDPELPEHAAIDHKLKNYLVICVPLAMGLLMILGGIQGLFKRGPSNP